MLDIQCLSRPASVEIKNIPSNEKETHTDLMNVVQNIGKAAKFNIQQSEVRDVYRIPGKQTPKSIFVEFNSVHTKQELLTSIRSFNKDKKIPEKLNTTHISISGTSEPVYVGEYLPPSVRKLFFLARQFAKEHKYRFCWITNGRILLRKEIGDKHIQIISEETLSNLGTQM